MPGGISFRTRTTQPRFHVGLNQDHPLYSQVRLAFTHAGPYIFEHKRNSTLTRGSSVAYQADAEGSLAQKFSGSSVAGTQLADGAGFETIVPTGSLFWIVIRFQIVSLGARRVLFADFSAAGGAHSVRFEQTATNTYLFGTSNGATTYVVEASGVTVGVHSAAMWVGDDSVLRLSIDGGPVAAGQTMLAARANGTDLRLGSAGAFVSLPFNGFVAAMVVGEATAGEGATTGSMPVGAVVELSRNIWAAWEPEPVFDALVANIATGVTVDVPAASLTLSAQTPTVAATANQRVVVPAASLSLAASAPSVAVSDHQAFAVPAASLTLAAQTPSVAVSDHQAVAVPAASLSLTANTPAVSTSDQQAVAVPAGALTLAAQTPTVAVTDHQLVAVPAASLSLAAQTPAVSLSGNQVVQVPAAALALTANAPVVGNDQTIAIPAAELTLAANAPAAAVSDQQAVAVPAAALTLAAIAPGIVVTANITVSVPAASMAVAGVAPGVIVTNHVLVRPPAASLTLAASAPFVNDGGVRVIDPYFVAVAAGRSFTATAAGREFVAKSQMPRVFS